MRIVYYPGVGADEASPLKKLLNVDLRSKCLKQWKLWYGFSSELSQPSFQINKLLSFIRKESAKPWGKRRFAYLPDSDVYEYRGTQHREGTIRIYCCFTEDTFYILHAECKHDNKDEAHIAAKRKKEMEF